MLTIFFWTIPILFLVAILIGLFVMMTRVFNTVPIDYSGNPADHDISYEAVSFMTSKQLKLSGWWIACPKEKQQVLILVHGWRRNAERMLPYVEALHPHFNLLVFDSRNHGKSDSDNFTSMPKFTEDILAALDYVDSRKDVGPGKRSLLGLSMGGGAAIYAGAKDSRIDRVITVGAFANPADIMKKEYKKRHIPYFPLVSLLFVYFQYLIGERFDDFAPEKQISKSKADFLIIHGEADQTTPFSHAKRLVSAASDNKAALYAIREAGHSDCHTYPGFWKKIVMFLDKP